MAKDLPYFKFFCSEWNDGDITLESLEVQGLFINICSYYWSNECIVLTDKCVKKFKYIDQKLFNDLFNSGVLKDDDGFIRINFLDEQKGERAAKSAINSENGKKGGRPKKRKESETKPNALISESETKGNKKRKEKIREDKEEYTNKAKAFITWFNSEIENLKGSGKFRLTDKVKKQFNARINDGYVFKNYVSAFKAISSDEFHKEKNYKYLTPEFITRADQLEKWCNVTPEKEKGKGLGAVSMMEMYEEQQHGTN